MGKFKFKTKKGRERLKIFNCSDDVVGAKRLSGPHIEVFSNKSVYVDGCCGILEYNDVYIKIRVKKGMIIITGSGLDVPIFEGPAINVTGDISTIEFCVG